MSKESVAVPLIVLNVMPIMDVVSSARAQMTLYSMENVRNVILTASLASITPRSVLLVARISR